MTHAIILGPDGIGWWIAAISFVVNIALVCGLYWSQKAAKEGAEKAQRRAERLHAQCNAILAGRNELRAERDELHRQLNCADVTGEAILRQNATMVEKLRQPARTRRVPKL